MELVKIQISNFRSIQAIEIDIQEVNGSRCLILVGKNEAGKSNILKAISAVFGKYTVSAKDQRKEAPGENIKDNEYYIRAVFELNQNDFKSIYTDFCKQYHNVENIEFQNNLNLENFIQEAFPSIVLRIGIDNNRNPYPAHWKLSEQCKDRYKFNKSIVLNDEKYFDITEDENLFSVERLASKIFDLIQMKWDLKSMYQCEKWEYKEEFLLPSRVNARDFEANPDICIPLKKLFFLASKSDIAKAMEKARNQDDGLHNLLDNVSKLSTKFFKDAWRGFEDVRFSLIPNGDFIEIFIEENIKFSMEDRSDGFKHFISMLLSFSNQNDSEERHKILLIDEPDTHLYPISVKNLRDELLKIAQKHLVICSTHSPYLLDDTAIGENSRHLIIQKEKGVTSVADFKRHPNYLEDEFLLQAIGCSVFERIKNKNILFEGYNDYKLFEKNKTKDFKDYGALYLAGIDDIGKIVPILMLTGTKFCIVADSDIKSKGLKANFEKNYPDYKDCWLEYDVCGKQYETLEDFFKQDFLTEILNERYDGFKFDCKKSAMKNIEEHIRQQGDKKEDIREIKNKLVESSGKQNLQKYSLFLRKLKEKMEGL